MENKKSEKDYTVQVSGFGSRESITIKWFFSSDFKSEAEALKAAKSFFESTLKDLTHGCSVYVKVINWKGDKKEKTVIKKLKKFQ